MEGRKTLKGSDAPCGFVQNGGGETRTRVPDGPCGWRGEVAANTQIHEGRQRGAPFVRGVRRMKLGPSENGFFIESNE